MKIQRLLVPLFLAIAPSLASVPAHAGGVYVGGGIGRSNLEDSAGNPGGVPFDESATAGKAFVGYHLDFLPLLKFAAEAGYRDLGKPDTRVGGVPVEYHARGFDYGLMGGVGLGPVEVMARVGGMEYKLRKSVGSVTNDYDGHAPVYGVGAWFTLFGVGVRAEYERIKIDQLDKSDMVSVSAFYQF